jgi:predicted ester cyclase
VSTDRNKAIVRRYIDELNARNVRIVDELVGEGLREIVLDGYRRKTEAFPDYRVEIDDMISEGDQVMVEWTHTGTHRGDYDGVAPTGRTITGHIISVYRVIDGRIVDARGVWDRAEMWEQLDLIDANDPIWNVGAS